MKSGTGIAAFLIAQFESKVNALGPEITRNSKAASRLAEQFERRQVSKIYWGALEGDLGPGEGTWTDWLRKIKEESRSQRVAEGTEGARQAVLRYRRLQVCAGGCLTEFRPETGRMHQIRLQAALRGHPVQGDEHYGAKLAFGPPAPVPRDRIIALHARSLTFLHPIRYEPITLVAPLPPAWHEIDLPRELLDPASDS